MVLDDAVLHLICDLEYIIGDKCYNPNSYNGWTGEEGKWFRYPITIPTPDGDEWKVYGNVSRRSFGELTPEFVKAIYYKMGSNELMIGQGIIAALEEIEKRYGISFSELEKARQSKS